jgi:hypothetical protein
MALSKMAVEIAALKAEIAALKAAPIAGKPATFHTSAEVKAGQGFPCTAEKPCSRTLKTVKRAGIHGVDAGGHEPR